MKRTFSIATSLALFCALAHGQIWIDVGAKGGYGLGILTNANLMQDNNHEMRLGTGYSYGGKLGLNFGRNHGFTFDAIWAKNTQLYDYNATLAEIRNNELAWQNLHLYVMYRLQTDGVYFEAGPRFSRLQNITHTFAGLDIAGNGNYADQTTGAAIGWGGYLLGNEFFVLMLGMRLDYTISDFVSTKGQDAGFPAPYRLPRYSAYKPTRPVSGQVVMELNFGLGGYAKRRCGERAFIFGRRW